MSCFIDEDFVKMYQDVHDAANKKNKGIIWWSNVTGYLALL